MQTEDAHIVNFSMSMTPYKMLRRGVNDETIVW